MTKKKAISCGNCGSADIEIISDELGQCRQCGTKIHLPKSKSTKIVNNYFVDSCREDIIEITKERDVMDFKREALITLLSNVYSPAQLLDEADFKPIETIYSQYVQVEADLYANFSATIGYDREEQYTDYETVVSNGRSYQKPVTKTRTVTDWQPFSGSTTEHSTGYAKLNYKENDDSVRFESFISENFNQLEQKPFSDSNYDVDPIVPSIDDKDRAVLMAKYHLEEQCKKSLPGDRNKDFSCHISHNVTKTRSFIVPEFVWPFSFNDQEWDVRTYKASPKSYVGNCPSAKQEITTLTEIKTKPLAITNIVVLTLSIILSLIFAIILKSKSTYLILGLNLVISIIFYIIYNAKYKKTNSQIKEIFQEHKKQQLINYLNKNNMPPLTEKEEELFNDWRSE